MGITFRSGSYIRFVRIGGRTIKEGEAAAIWNSKGVHKQIVGPRRVQLFFSTVRFLTRHKAESHQYLVVKHRDGRVEHIRGPVQLYQNPAFHDDVFVKDGIFLKSSSDFILVRNVSTDNLSEEDNNNMSANIRKIHGPTLFIPSPEENIQEFEWSKNRFHTLHDSTYPIDVTLQIPLNKNNHHVEVNLHIEYKISSSCSTEKLLKHNDPLTRIENAILSDGLMLGDSLCNKLALFSDKENHDDGLRQADMKAIFNNLESYPKLCEVAEESDIQIISVNYTCFSLDEDLSNMLRKQHTSSQEILSKLKSQTQKEKLLALEKQQQVQLEKDMHEMQVESLKRKMELRALEEKGSNEIVKMRNETTLLFLEKVKEMDMVEVLLSKNYHINNLKQAQGASDK